MQAIRLQTFGPADNLVLEQLDDLTRSLARCVSPSRRAACTLAAGDWRPLVSTYPLADAARAHADLEGRRALGKVVLTVDR